MQQTAKWGLDGTNTSLHAGYRERWNIRHVGSSWFRLLSLESFRPNPEMATSRPRIVRQRINVPQATYTAIMTYKSTRQRFWSFAQELGAFIISIQLSVMIACFGRLPSVAAQCLPSFLPSSLPSFLG